MREDDGRDPLGEGLDEVDGVVLDGRDDLFGEDAVVHGRGEVVARGRRRRVELRR